MEAETVKDIHSDVIERCKAGDISAQFKLYDLYKKAMYNICLRMVNDREEAEDVLQESFLSAFRNLDKFEGRATFGAWLKRIVINNALSHLKNKRAIFEDLDEKHDLSDENISIEEHDVELKVSKINQAMMQLADGFRTVLSLYLFEGYDHREIASILDITESTSKSQYLRAKRKLLEIMKEK